MEGTRRVLFEYNFKSNFDEVTKAYLNKYKYEDRYSLTSVSDVEQEGDSVCLTRVSNSVNMKEPIKEVICINRETQSMDSKIVLPNTDRVPEINHFHQEGGKTLYQQNVYQTDGRQDICLAMFKRGVSNVLRQLKFDTQ